MITIPVDSVSQADVLLKVAGELYDLYQRKTNELPYRLNVITELHANENANSRILRGLLQYSTAGKFPLLLSFVEKLQAKCHVLADIKVSAPVLTNEESRIDLLIKEKKSYAIIVENKIWDAVDQHEQIERYVDYVQGCGIPKNQIFVVYLTGDGSKEISEYSLTDKARKALGMASGTDGRFICMNFKHDIVPWLEEISQLDLVTNEPLLSSAVCQYLDYLKEVFGLRQEDKLIETHLEIRMMEKLQLNSLKEMLGIWEEVSKLNDLLCNASNSRINAICESKICRALEKKGYTIESSHFSYTEKPFFSIEVLLPEFSKCLWKIESDGNRIYSGLYILEGKTIAKKYISMLGDVYPEQNTWWAGWKWHDHYIDDDFWVNLESHSTKFVNEIVTEIERVRTATEDMNL